MYEESSSRSSRVKVVVRTRPTSNFAQGVISLEDDAKTINIFQKKKESAGAVNNQQEHWSFVFDKVLQNVSQEIVYDEVGKDVVESVLEGVNGTIMAYGQTGAGKTFSMTGATENYKHRGLIPRGIESIFKEIRGRPEMAYTVRVSYLEIYNEMVYDLLIPYSEADKEYKIVEDGNGVTHVKGLTQQLVTSEEEALNFLFEGETNRAIASHSLNNNSSRSHCIFTVYLEIRSRVESSEKVMTAKLNLVDLAGSERLKKTQSEGNTMKEAMYINKSLSFLEQVVVALGEKKRDHIPYRRTTLTNVLKDSLGGNCKTFLLANIWGNVFLLGIFTEIVENQHLEETISTLRFATRMMRVSNEPIVNVQYDPLQLVKKYEQEIKELKSELAMHDALANRGHVQYDPYTDEQRYDLNQTVKKYLSGQIDEIEVESLRQVKEIFCQFKILLNNMESEIDQKYKQSVTSNPVVATSSVKNKPPSTPKEDKKNYEEEGVGEIESTGGFGIGLAPSAAKPLNSPSRQKKKRNKPKELEKSESEAESPQKLESIKSEVKTRKLAKSAESALPPEQGQGEEPKPETSPPKPPAPDRDSAFELYKQEKGLESSKILNENKELIKEKKKVYKDLAVKVNTIKHDIDRLKTIIDKRQLEKANKTESNPQEDAQEVQNLIQLKDAKQHYKDSFTQLQNVKGEIDYTTRLIDKCREKLIMDFEQWYQDSFDHGNAKPNLEEKESEDVMDYQEKFEKMNLERVIAEDPESSAFYNARKNVYGINKASIGLPKITKKSKKTPFKL